MATHIVLSQIHKKTLPLFNGASETHHEDFDKYLKILNYKFKNTNKENGGLIKVKNNKIELFFDAGEPPENIFFSKLSSWSFVF